MLIIYEEVKDLLTEAQLKHVVLRNPFFVSTVLLLISLLEVCLQVVKSVN